MFVFAEIGKYHIKFNMVNPFEIPHQYVCTRANIHSLFMRIKFHNFEYIKSMFTPTESITVRESPEGSSHQRVY